MSKEFLLQYVRGIEPKNAYHVAYSVNPDSGDIQIHICEEFTDTMNAGDMFIQVCETKEDVITNVPDEAILEAARAYLNGEKVLTI